MGSFYFSLSRGADATVCEVCREALGESTMGVRCDRSWRSPIPPPRWVCVRCGLDLDVESLRDALRANAVAFAEREAIEAIVEARLAAIRARARGLEVAVEPARDRQGRPSVRALFFGLIASIEQKTGAAFDAALGGGRCATSAKRRYRFDSFDYGRTLASYDPAQPLIALVYGINARPADQVMQSNHDRYLWNCFARGYPPPLLWLQGVGERKARDAHVTRAREIVARSGYDADACATLCCKAITPDALAALVEALDQHFDGREFSSNPDGSLRCAQALLREAKLGEFESLTSTLRWKVTFVKEADGSRETAVLDELDSVLEHSEQHKLLAALREIREKRAKSASEDG